jgi:hypothetical protein
LLAETHREEVVRWAGAERSERGSALGCADDGVCDLIQLEHLAGEGKRSIKRPRRQDEDKPGRLK